MDASEMSVLCLVLKQRQKVLEHSPLRDSTEATIPMEDHDKLRGRIR